LGLFAVATTISQESLRWFAASACYTGGFADTVLRKVEKLCLHYGPLIGHIGSQPYHDFPSPSALTDPSVESHLRQLGFGYRAKYLYQTAVMVAKERDSGWLNSLRNPESLSIGDKPTLLGNKLEAGKHGYREAHEQLLELQGVGPKVADCVCLMGLGWGEAVPVDTHGRRSREHIRRALEADRLNTVWQIAQRDYKFGKGKHKSLTKATYDAVGDHFRELWGKEAGWAHSVLFTADLRAFSERLSTKTEVKDEEMVLKVEANGEADKVSATMAVFTEQQVKRELGEDDDKMLEIQEKTTKRKVKRRRIA